MKRNELVEYYDSLPTETLIQAIKEMKEDDPKGIVRMGGIVREVATKHREMTGQDVSAVLWTARVAILERYAFRMVK